MSRATPASGRLAVVLGPREVAALGRARGSDKQTDYARVLIQRLVGSSGHVRDLLVAHPAPPLPLDRRQRTRLDVRMPLDRRWSLDRWCGEVLAPADAFRAALHLDAAGRLAGAARVVEGSGRSGSAPRPTPGSRPPTRSEEGPPTPSCRSRRARASGVATSQVSPHDRALHEVAARVRRRREADPFYDPGFGAACGTDSTVEVSSGDSDATEAMIEDLVDEPSSFRLVRTWSNAAEIEFAHALADRQVGTELRLLVGVANDPEQVALAFGVPDACALAERIAGLARLIEREGTVEVTTHWIENDEPCWIVEVEASLR